MPKEPNQNRSHPHWIKAYSNLEDNTVSDFSGISPVEASGVCPDCSKDEACEGGSVEDLNPSEFKIISESEIVIFNGRSGNVTAAKHKGKSVQLNKPHRISKGQPGYGRKMYVVYVGTGGGKVKRITFGDPKLGQRPRNPAARKSFRARHKCHLKTDRTTPGYWACHYPPNW